MTAVVKRLIKRFPGLYMLLQRSYPFVMGFPCLLADRRGARDYLRSTWSLLRRSPFVAGQPVNITIEPTNTCNLRCPVCETGSGELGRPARHMLLAEFLTILDKVASHTNTLMFYYMGEPFLNRDAYQMIRAAKEEGIPWVTTCTNGDAVDPEQLLASGIDEVSFQIGGMSQETHQVYRINSDLKKVLHNLMETVRLKREQRLPLRVACGMILMRHNEHEVALFRRTMAEIGVDEAVEIAPCVRTVAQGKLYLPSDKRHWYYDPPAFRAGELRPRILPDNQCAWLYYSLTIHANGDVVPCCRDPKGEHVMGNLLQQELTDIWNGERFCAFRRAIQQEQSRLAICKLCSGYPASALK